MADNELAARFGVLQAASKGMGFGLLAGLAASFVLSRGRINPPSLAILAAPPATGAVVGAAAGTAWARPEQGALWPARRVGGGRFGRAVYGEETAPVPPTRAERDARARDEQERVAALPAAALLPAELRRSERARRFDAAFFGDEPPAR
jgi:hypothetical protein